VVKVSDLPNALFINYSFGDVTFEELIDHKGSSLLIFIGESVESEVKKLEGKFDILTLSD
jgi:hypothetical protein